MRAALDTNVLVYAEGANGDSKQAAALDLINRLPAGRIVLPAQVSAELFNLLTRKVGWSRERAVKAVLTWQASMPLIEITSNVLASAMALATAHQFSIWDSIVLASADEANCRLLLSEDLQDGFTWRGVTVVNPFATAKNKLLFLFLNSAQ